jgi:hypothetical protein
MKDSKKSAKREQLKPISKDWPLVCRKCVRRDKEGVLRFKAKALVEWIVDRFGDAHDYHWCARHEETPCPTLNSMAVAAAQKAFPLAEYKQFYRDMGYSLCGFSEVFEGEPTCPHFEERA